MTLNQEEQAIVAPIQNDTTETVAVEPNTTEPEHQEPKWVAPNEQEYQKALQSASSKAKFEILKELGVKSVQEFVDLKTTYENSIKDAGETRSKLEESEKENTRLSEDIAVMKAGVSDEFKEDFLTLVHSKMSAEKSFDDAAKEVLDKNPTWKVGQSEPIKIGNDKSETKVDSSDEQRRKSILRMAGL